VILTEIAEGDYASATARVENHDFATPWNHLFASLLEDKRYQIAPKPCFELIWCLDNYFEEKKKDCYFVVFGRKFPIKPNKDIKISKNPPGREALIGWFTDNFPHVVIEPVWPHSSNSFSLCLDREYDGSITIEFDEESLLAFCAAWEDEDQNGCSKDGTFTCYHIPYASWLENKT
jgi:hypothetical protein